MTLPSANDPVSPARTITIYRPTGGIEGYREIHDEVSNVTVATFAWVTVREAPTQAMPAGYILAAHGRAYFGETNDAKRRMIEHARDLAKNWVREAYIITGVGNASELWSDPTTAEYIQYRLTELAEQAGLVDIVKGVNPRVPNLSTFRRATLEALIERSLPLLFDAGCRVFHSNFGSMRRVPPDAEIGGLEEAGSMAIGVTAAPPLGSELEISYVDLWARGYPTDRGGFVVMAGSEVRSTSNPSGRTWVDKFRCDLREAGALLAIPGRVDRERLCTAVEFDSASSATKLVTGSRDGGKWIPPRYPQPILSAA
jgi:hypothetical protein